MYYVYILYSLKDRKFYRGLTSDLNRRLKEHNSGKNTSTAYRRPLKLVYYEAYIVKKRRRIPRKIFKNLNGYKSNQKTTKISHRVVKITRLN